MLCDFVNRMRNNTKAHMAVAYATEMEKLMF